MKTLPSAKRESLEKLRAVIRAASPRAVERISYGMPTFDYQGHLVSFAAFKDHYSLFPMSGDYIASHLKELEKYKTSRGTIQFPYEKPVPKMLVRKIVRERMKENEEKAGKKLRGSDPE